MLYWGITAFLLACAFAGAYIFSIPLVKDPMTQPTRSGPAHPIGYREVQSSWVGRKTPDETFITIAGEREKFHRENPGYVDYGARVEHAIDGARVEHFTLYLGFAPAHASSEPLNPRNMNDAPLPQVGMPTVADVTLPMGWKEERFGRGT